MKNNKKIFSIGYQIPGNYANYVEFSSEQSLMDADILVISPETFNPEGNWISFTTSDGGCYNIETSKVYKQRMSLLKKEVQDHLNSGKNVFVLLSKEEKYPLAYGVSSEKKSHSYSTETYSNYNFLPLNVGTLISVSGKYVEFSGNQIFSDFYEKFKGNLEYQLYVENPGNAQVIFTGKDKTKILGAAYKVGPGNLIVLPYLKYDYSKFVESKKNKKGEGKEYWTKDALKFGNMLVDCLIKIDRDMNKSSGRTPRPEWANKSTFIGEKETKVIQEIINENGKILTAKKRVEELEVQLENEQILKNLLFETGKTLENAVIEAFKILGYSAENYNDGELELDQVIRSPEGSRFIGECEGKDSSAINIDKFRQLEENIQSDLQKAEVKEPAIGILFGNGFRLTDPADREEQFTAKCLSSAKRGTILIRTSDLYYAAKYLRENRDDSYARTCRDAILAAQGSIVKFPLKPKV